MVRWDRGILRNDYKKEVFLNIRRDLLSTFLYFMENGLSVYQEFLFIREILLESFKLFRDYEEFKMG